MTRQSTAMNMGSRLTKQVKQLKVEMEGQVSAQVKRTVQNRAFVDSDVTQFLRRNGGLDELWAEAIRGLMNKVPEMKLAASVIEDHDTHRDFVLATVFVPSYGDLRSTDLEVIVREHCEDAERLLERVTFTL
jgi:hypothetical protein